MHGAELSVAAGENDQAGDWLGAAIEARWGMAEALLQFPELRPDSNRRPPGPQLPLIQRSELM
jgi:hypothetical protein